MKLIQPLLNIFLAVALLGDEPVSAYPKHGEILIAHAVNCNVGTGVLAAVKAMGPPATSFCSSYLDIPTTSTVTVTATPTKTVTAAAVESTIFDLGCVPSAPPVKRSNNGPPGLGKGAVPAALKVYQQGEISSACDCLSIMPKATTTITTTAVAAVATFTITPASVTTICTGSTCTPVGQPCIFESPELCCSQTCACIGGVCNCYDWNR